MVSADEWNASVSIALEADRAAAENLVTATRPLSRRAAWTTLVDASGTQWIEQGRYRGHRCAGARLCGITLASA